MIEALLAVVRKYNKYPLQAYLLIFETLEKLDGVKHVTGEQLARAMLLYSINKYGFLASAVWRELKLLRSEDIGEMVYHLVDEKLIGKQDSDRKEDFKGVLTIADFDTVQMTIVDDKKELRIEYKAGE